MNQDLFGEPYHLVLRDEDAETVLKPFAEGDWGGTQGFGDALQRRVREDGTLEMTTSELDRAWHYSRYSHGHGGWQSFFRVFTAAGLAAGWREPKRKPTGDLGQLLGGNE